MDTKIYLRIDGRKWSSKALILFLFLVSFNLIAMAQETKPGEEIMAVSPGLKYTLESYWRDYREDDWENLYRSMHTTRNKEEFIAEKKRIKANSPLGFKAI